MHLMNCLYKKVLCFRIMTTFFYLLIQCKIVQVLHNIRTFHGEKDFFLSFDHQCFHSTNFLAIKIHLFSFILVTKSSKNMSDYYFFSCATLLENE